MGAEPANARGRMRGEEGKGRQGSEIRVQGKGREAGLWLQGEEERQGCQKQCWGGVDGGREAGT